MIIKAICREVPVNKPFYFEKDKEYTFETNDNFDCFIINFGKENYIKLNLPTFLAYFSFNLTLGQQLSMLVSYDEYDFVKLKNGQCYLEEI